MEGNCIADEKACLSTLVMAVHKGGNCLVGIYRNYEEEKYERSPGGLVKLEATVAVPGKIRLCSGRVRRGSSRGLAVRSLGFQGGKVPAGFCNRGGQRT